MSTTYARITFRDGGGNLFDPTSVVMSEPGGTYGVKRNDTDAVVVADGASLTKLSTGIYETSFTDPASDLTYTAYFEYVIESETYWTPKTIAGGAATGTSLMLTFADLYGEVGLEKYSTRTPSGDDLTESKLLANRAYLRFLNNKHPWTFLQPAATIVFWPTTTGTVSGQASYASPSSTITATAAAFYASMVGGTFTYDTSGTEYTIVGYTSSTVILVTGDSSAEASGDTFTITADGNYALPADCEEVRGTITYPQNTRWRRLERRSPDWIRARRAYGPVTSDPIYFAVEALPFVTGTGQRRRLLVYPPPNTLRTMHYAYRVHPTLLVNDADFPIGGQKHATTILAAVRYGAEMSKGGTATKGVRKQEYLDALADSIARDNADRTSNLGYNSDPRAGGEILRDTRMDTSGGVVID